MYIYIYIYICIYIYTNTNKSRNPTHQPSSSLEIHAGKTPKSRNSKSNNGHHSVAWVSLGSSIFPWSYIVSRLSKDACTETEKACSVSTCLPIYLPTYLSTYPPTDAPTYPPTRPPTYILCCIFKRCFDDFQYSSGKQTHIESVSIE